MINKFTIYLLFLFISISKVTVYADSFILKHELIVNSLIVPISSLFEENPDIPGQITVSEDTFLSNRIIRENILSAGIPNPVVIGNGVKIILIENKLTEADLITRLQAAYPSIASDIQIAGLPDGWFYDLDSAWNNDKLAISLDYVVFENGTGTVNNKTWVISAPMDKAIEEEPETEDNLEPLIDRIIGDSVFVKYQQDALSIRLAATLLEDLGDGYYLLENPFSGEEFTAYYPGEDQ